MLGNNPIEKRIEDHNGRNLHIVQGSPFYTIQGEGPYAGRPAVFVRLHGCPLRCWFCDTEFSNPDDPIIPIDDLVMQVEKASYRICSFVVITGGEPLRQNILPFCRMLNIIGYTIQIETAGMYWIDDLEKYAKIVCSPKTPTIAAEIEKHAMAYKYVIDYRMSFDGPVPIFSTQRELVHQKLAAPPPDTPIYLSPMDTQNEKHNARNRQLVAAMAKEYGCYAGLQMHKFFEVP